MEGFVILKMEPGLERSVEPVVTWIVLANTRHAKVLAHHGPGTGLVPVAGKYWVANSPHSRPDQVEMEQKIAALSARRQPSRRRLRALFVREVIGSLAHDLASEQFDRLVLVAPPPMPGLMTETMDHRLKYALVDKVAEDLSAHPVHAVQAHLGEIIAV